MGAASTTFLASTAAAGLVTSVVGQTPAPLVAVAIVGAMGCLVIATGGRRPGAR